MSTILGNPITLGGGGASLNIDFDTTPPSDTSKLWVPLGSKPSAVECSPILNYGPNTIQSLSNIIPSDQKWCPVIQLVGDELYIIGGSKTDSDTAAATTDKITVVNLKTNVTTTKEYTFPVKIKRAYSAVVDGKIYTFGGMVAVSSSSYSSLSYGYDIFCYDVQNDTIEKVVETSNPKIEGATMNTACSVNGKIYIFSHSGSSIAILMFDPATNTLTSTGVTASGYYPAVAPYGQYIYCFGGKPNAGSSSYSSTVKRFDTVTNTAEILSDVLPYGINYTAAATVGTNIYLFPGNSDSGAETKREIFKFDVTTETLQMLSVEQTYASLSRTAIAYGLDIYIFDTVYNKSEKIDKFSTNTALQHNHLFLQSDFGFDDMWTAINGKDTQLKVHLVNAYLGDSDNIAQLTDAYLYDSDSATWKSLDGVSMTADMLAALATLGVT